MDKPELTPEQLASLNEDLEQAGRLEVLINQPGWGDVKAFYQNKVQAFASGMLINEKTPIADFEAERQRIIGIKQMLGLIDSKLNILKEFRESKKDETKGSA